MDEINELNKDELFDLLCCYDGYVWQVIHENEGEPVGVAEFFENDYQDILEEREKAREEL